jgi:hypothetical protein
LNDMQRFFSRRGAAAAACFLAPLSLHAATPASGTLTDTIRSLSYTFPAEPRANASNQIEGTDPAYVCSPTDVPYACDTFTVTVTLPAGYMASHPNDIVLFQPTTTSAASDIDSQLEDEDGTVLTVTRDNPPTQPAILFRPEDGTHVYLIQIVPGTPHEGGSATVDLVEGPPPPPDTPPLARFQALATPPALGNDAGEPSIGYNPATKRGLFQTGLETLRYTLPENRSDDPLNPDGLPEACDALFEDVTSAFTGTVTLDPIGFVDPIGGRGYAGQLGPKQHTMTYTDDDGDTWSNSVGNFPAAAGVDHQTIGWGPYVPGGAAGPLTDYPNAVYYCSQDVAYANCSRSDDGGATFLPPVPAYTTADCGGLHGHIRAAPDGTVYLPNKSCNAAPAPAQQAVAVSEDNGATWQVRRVPDSTAGNTDPQMALASDGTGYFCYVNSLGSPSVAVTHDRGLTWSPSFNLGNLANIRNAVFAQAIAGDPDRAACGFIATETAGNPDAEDFEGIWYAYIAMTYDGGENWSMTNVTPGDPVQGYGGICTSGTTCGANRNLLDFNEMTLDELGRPILGFADGCIGPCVADPTSIARSAKGAIARVAGGKSLYEKLGDLVLDLPEPYRPQAACLAGTRDADGSALAWRSPVDNGASAITGYTLYRATTLDAIRASTTPLVQLTPKNKYNDTTADPNEPEYFYKIVAKNAVGASVSSNIIKVVLDTSIVPESRCIVPGLTVLTDAEGDSTGGVQSQDLRSVSVAQPLNTAGTPKLFFTIKTTNLNTLTAGSAYYVSFNSPDNIVRGVRMEVTNPSAPTFFTYVARSNATGTITDGRFVDTKAPADPASTYNPTTGVITIIALPSALGLNLPGEKLTGFNSGVTQTTDIGGIGSGATNVQDEMPNGLGRIGEFELKANTFCEINTPPQAALLADVQTGAPPLTVHFDASGSSDADAQDTIVEYVFDFGDGTEVITQALPAVTHVYDQIGAYNARVRVKDSRGLNSTTFAAKVIQVTDLAGGTLGAAGNNRLGGALAPLSVLGLGLLALLRRRRFKG